jgi:cytochrome c
MRHAALVGLAMMLLSWPCGAADLAAGKAAFGRCLICHNVAAGAGAKVGPNLRAVFGRKAGTWDSFPYSAAMKKSGIVWNDDTLARFLRDPRKFIPGNNMAVPGIKDDKRLADLLAYLHQAAQ